MANATVTVDWLLGQGNAKATLTPLSGGPSTQLTIPDGGGSVTFPNVSVGDLIFVGGNAASTNGGTITIDRTTHPTTPQAVSPGPFGFNFIVKA